MAEGLVDQRALTVGAKFSAGDESLCMRVRGMFKTSVDGGIDYYT